MVRTGVLVSGEGTNLQAIIDAKASGKINNCELAAVVSSKPDARALQRASSAGIPGYVVDKPSYPDRMAFTLAILDTLQRADIELVVYAGFNFILEQPMIDAFRNRMINIHPTLIPSFCGMGYYGLRVHEAVLAHGVKLTGATAHFVNEIADDGPIILQKAVPVIEGDTPQTLQRRVMEEAEWIILPQAISLYCEGRLVINGRIVSIST
ncbi:MAG: phosphoribosylglycinamide formyltransferase [Oscillospiraceae bacterium]|nr:phosphoribosylglycinamide formyltransferase [Oscillospiraceae bacterium]